MIHRRRCWHNSRASGCFEADAATGMGPAARKGEAILTDEDDASEYISLLDGDCIVTGDITPHLAPAGETLFARHKSPEEDGRVFRLSL